MQESPVWCFTSRQGDDDSSSDSDGSRTVYAGTGPNGVVLSSTDLSTWSTFTTVGDCHVRTITVWANAIFMGTQPCGRIYVHNFESGEEYLFVETEDEAVTAFAEYEGKLFAGTSPAGIVYSFDGIVWKEEHRPYGSGVTAMAVADGKLLVFSKGAEGPVMYDGSSWSPFLVEKNEDSSANLTTGITVAANRIPEKGVHGANGHDTLDRSRFVVAGLGGFSEEDAHEVRPTSPQFNVAAAVQTPSGVAFGGLDNGAVLLANAGQNSLSRIFDIGIPVSALVYISQNCIMAASGGTVFLAKGTIT